MKRKLIGFLMVLVVACLSFQWVWAQCPEDTIDRGECDTLQVVPWNDGLCDSFPCFVRVLLLVTHDSNTFYLESPGKWVQDSISAFVIPLRYTHTNPSAYCSLSSYWNSSLLLGPSAERSIFRHLVDEQTGDTIMVNRMMWMQEQWQGWEWDTRFLFVSTDSSYFRMSLIPNITTDRRWWEGERTLLATLTFLVSDTMHICIDSTFWPPTGRLKFTEYAGWTYIPRHNLPMCFKVDTAGVGTAVEWEELETGGPERVSLSQNYPNPFNPVTNVEFSLHQSEQIRLEIFNILGQRVKTLVNDQTLKRGTHNLSWDGRDDKGNAVPSGMYFFRLQAGDFSDVKKMIFLR